MVTTNASFETPSLGAGNFSYSPGGATWSFTAFSGIAANGSAFSFLAAPDGTQVAFLQGQSSFSESITSVSVGDVISFFAALRTTNPGETFIVSYAGSVIGTFLASSLSTTWTKFSVTIPVAAPSSGLLEFASAGTGGADTDVGIDLVTSVPEPMSMQLFASSLCLKSFPSENV